MTKTTAHIYNSVRDGIASESNAGWIIQISLGLLVSLSKTYQSRSKMG